MTFFYYKKSSNLPLMLYDMPYRQPLHIGTTIENRDKSEIYSVHLFKETNIKKEYYGKRKNWRNQ
jgi:hypothetical protein